MKLNTVFPGFHFRHFCFSILLGCLNLILINPANAGNDTGGNTNEKTCLDYLEASKGYTNRNLDSALYAALEAKKCIGSVEGETAIRILLNLGDVYSSIGDMDISFTNYIQAKQQVEEVIAKRPSDPALILLHSDVLVKIGVFNFYKQSYEKSIRFYEDALGVLESTSVQLPAIETANRKVKIFNNIAAIHLQQSDFNTALSYFLNALKINDQLNNRTNEGSLKNNIGLCYLEKGLYDLAKEYFLQSLAIRKLENDMRGQAQCLNNLGKVQIFTNNSGEAEKYFLEALTLGRLTGNAKSKLVSLESLSSLYEVRGDYKSAFKTYKALKNLNDSVFSSESESNIAKLEDSYKRDKERKIHQLEMEHREVRHKEETIRNLAVIVILFFFLLTAFLLIVLLRGKVKNEKLKKEKLQLEHEKLSLESQTLQENLEHKNRELTANALFLLKNNELISKISERLLEAKAAFKPENQKVIQDIVGELRSSQVSHVWDEFEAHFTQVHSDFYQSLHDKFPNLTGNEKKLCAFLRLNMSTKDISAITHQSVNSITVARSRLRKKLNIEGEDIHLVNFLMEV